MWCPNCGELMKVEVFRSNEFVGYPIFNYFMCPKCFTRTEPLRVDAKTQDAADKAGWRLYKPDEVSAPSKKGIYLMGLVTKHILGE